MVKNKVIQKKYYSVMVEAMCPCILSFKILAETPEEAFALIKGKSPISIKPKIAGRRDKKVTIYEMGSSIILFIKNLF